MSRAVSDGVPRAARGREPGLARQSSRSPWGTKGVWKDSRKELNYRLVDDSPYTKAGANALSPDGRTLWYSASVRAEELAMQEAASAARSRVMVTHNRRMGSGVADVELGWFRHTGETRTVFFRKQKRVSYQLTRELDSL